jgi:hypothetical protein
MEAFGVVFATFSTLGYQLSLECGDGAGAADEGAAFAALAGATSTASWSPLVAAVRMMGAEGKGTAAGLPKTRTGCSTSTAASGWVVDRLGVHADRAAETGQMQANWTVVCGTKSGEIPFGSSLQPP